MRSISIGLGSRRPLTALLIVTVMAVASIQAQAQSYPSKPIKLIVPTPAGSSVDIVARTIMPVASKILGQQIVIDNEGGGGAIPGTARAAKSSADGYTLVLGSVATHALNEHIFNAVPYDSQKDFVAVARLAAQTLIIAVPATSPAKSVREFVDLAKAGKVDKYGSPGLGTPAHLGAEAFKKVSGIDLKHIPFPAGPQPVLALGRGELDMMFYTYSSYLPAVEAKTIRLIGNAAEKRSGFLPDLPTMREQGFDVVISAWYGVYAPAGTPKDVVNKLADALNQAVADPDVIKILNATGTDEFPSKSPEEFDAYTKSERARYKAIVESAGVPKT